MKKEEEEEGEEKEVKEGRGKDERCTEALGERVGGAQDLPLNVWYIELPIVVIIKYTAKSDAASLHFVAAAMNTFPYALLILLIVFSWLKCYQDLDADF